MPERRRWEYGILGDPPAGFAEGVWLYGADGEGNLFGPNLVVCLNELGAEGWEVVGVGGNAQTLVLKRERVDG